MNERFTRRRQRQQPIDFPREGKKFGLEGIFLNKMF
jgi:hypothetical protein